MRSAAWAASFRTWPFLRYGRRVPVFALAALLRLGEVLASRAAADALLEHAHLHDLTVAAGSTLNVPSC